MIVTVRIMMVIGLMLYNSNSEDNGGEADDVAGD